VTNVGDDVVISMQSCDIIELAPSESQDNSYAGLRDCLIDAANDAVMSPHSIVSAADVPQENPDLSLTNQKIHQPLSRLYDSLVMTVEECSRSQ
jgi:hypothetical protein